MMKRARKKRKMIISHRKIKRDPSNLVILKALN
jgi:hypothetical protein